MLTLNQGNTYSITYNIQDPNNAVLDLTGALELKYKLARKKQTKALLEYDLASTELSFSIGAVVINIPSTAINLLEEGSYYHELWYVDSAGIPLTLMSEKLAVSSKLIKE